MGQCLARLRIMDEDFLLSGPRRFSERSGCRTGARPPGRPLPVCRRVRSCRGKLCDELGRGPARRVAAEEFLYHMGEAHAVAIAATLDAVVERHDSRKGLNLNLTADQKADLVEYLKSL